MREDTDIFTVPNELHELRLDKLLTLQYDKCSRSYIQWLIDQKAVQVNDKACKKSRKLQSGDIVTTTFLPTAEIDLTPEPIPLDILYEDDELLAVNKPSGMVVHPAPGNWTKTFVHALLYHCKDLSHEDTIRPGIVHRLDKETTGVLLAAKTSWMHQKLVELFSSRQIEKSYLAICLGIPPQEGLIETRIGRHPKRRKLMSVQETFGKKAKTTYRLLGSSGSLSLLDLSIETGRTHQIRVHLQHIGHPVLGDSVYGRIKENNNFGAFRQMLHCKTLSFIHPKTKKKLTISAEPAEDMQQCMAQIVSGVF